MRSQTLLNTDPNSDPLAGWDRDPAPFQTGPYTLSLTGTKFASSATVPEPGSMFGLIALGALGVVSKFKQKISASQEVK